MCRCCGVDWRSDQQRLLSCVWLAYKGSWTGPSHSHRNKCPKTNHVFIDSLWLASQSRSLFDPLRRDSPTFPRVLHRDCRFASDRLRRQRTRHIHSLMTLDLFWMTTTHPLLDRGYAHSFQADSITMPGGAFQVTSSMMTSAGALPREDDRPYGTQDYWGTFVDGQSVDAAMIDSLSTLASFVPTPASPSCQIPPNLS